MSFAVIGSDNLDGAFGEVGRNRLWTPVLLCWLAGVLIAIVVSWRGLSALIRVSAVLLANELLLMLAGNVVEYWFFNSVPHEGREGLARALAWLIFLLGFPILLLSLPLCGMALRRARAPLRIRAIAVNLALLVLPLAVLSITIGGFLIVHPRPGDGQPSGRLHPR